MDIRSDSLKDKSVLITGAARRIGASMATCLHEQGMNIIVHYRQSAEPANPTVAISTAVRQSELPNLRPRKSWRRAEISNR